MTSKTVPQQTASPEPSDHQRSPAPLAIVAFGGNALITPDDSGTIDEQLAHAQQAVESLFPFVKNGFRLVIVHGNGPQVGNELIRQEEAATKLPPMPLDVCVASTQGTMGYLLERCFRNAARRWDDAPPIATVLTQVRVSPQDPAFDKPTKPVGPFLNAYRATQLQEEQGKQVVEDSGRGWRVVVPSPRPIDVLGLDAIRILTDSGFAVIAGGGGGVPVHFDERVGDLGREAVIDKDFTASLIARRLDAHTLVILTGVARVSVYFGTPAQEDLRIVDIHALRHFHSDGQFPPGSMGPKIQAAIDFVAGGGQRCIITNAASLGAALAGEDGTHVVAGDGDIDPNDPTAKLRFEW